MESHGVVRSASQRQRHKRAIAEGLSEAPQPQAADIVRLIRRQDRDKPLAISDKISPIEMAFRFAAALLAE